MESQIWVVSTLLISIVLIVLTIVKLKFHPFLALLLASFFVGAMMGMSPLDMVNAIENGIGGTLGFLAAVIGLGHHSGQNDGDFRRRRTYRPGRFSAVAGCRSM